MTNDQLKEKVKEVLTLLNLNSNNKIDRILNSNCIDIEAIPEGDYRMAKNICIAILEDAANSLRPLSNSRENKKEIENIKMFV